MNWPLVVLVGTQVLFSMSDLLARNHMPRYGFTVQAFLTGWFALYFGIRVIAMFGQLFVFTSIELGKTMALFGATSIVIANILGFFLLKEVLSPPAYVAIVLAIIAFIILALK